MTLSDHVNKRLQGYVERWKRAETPTDKSIIQRQMRFTRMVLKSLGKEEQLADESTQP